jgi:hypothetical protein
VAATCKAFFRVPNGPDTPALGEPAHIARVTQAQIADTLAALPGKDDAKDVPAAAPPLPDFLPH